MTVVEAEDAVGARLLRFIRQVALCSNDLHLAAPATRLYTEMMGFEPELMCSHHRWTTPKRADNRWGRRSTSLYETWCLVCGSREVRNGLARLRREVTESAPVAQSKETAARE